MENLYPLISIIVPVFNAENWLERCFLSLQKQTYTNIEILIIDDGSTDGSAKICKDFCEKDSRFKYFYQENKGVSSARNKGLEVANGEYFAFCDGDDWVELDTYESLYRLLEKNDADISICSFIYDDQSMQKNDFVDGTKVFSFSANQAISEIFKDEKFAGHLCNKLFKKSVIKDLRFDTSVTIFEDMLLVWDAIFASKKVVFQELYKYHYFIHGSSAMRTFKKTSWSALTACEKLYLKTEKNCGENLVFAKKFGLIGSMVVAHMLYLGNALSKDNYKRVKQEIYKYYDKKAYTLLSKKDKLALKCLLCGRGFYRFSKKVFNVINKK